MPRYIVAEFDGDTPLETNARTFDNLRNAKSYARGLFESPSSITASYPKLKGDRKGGLHIDVYRADTGTCFLTLPGKRRK